MLLCIDIGNTHITLGAWDKDKCLGHWRVRTVRDQTSDEYAILLKSLLREGGCKWTAINRVAIASVVPPLTIVFSELFRYYWGIEPLIVGPGVRTGLRIRIDNPVELGADLVADAVAAYHRLRNACIVVNFGTATTFSAVSKTGDFLGVAIAPGLELAAEALASFTAQLPRVALVPPPAAIGKNTVHSMQSGLIFGYVGLVKELLQRIRAELGGQAVVIATGGLSSTLAPLIEDIDIVDPLLTLEGLRLISELNEA
nr:type III pantothenate kinase [Chloroflexota bacterium]